MFEAILQLIRQLAIEAPVLIALEDLHCADDATARLLGFIARRVQRMPVVVLATARDEEIEPRSALRGAITELRAAGALTDMSLGPLSRQQSGRLVDEWCRRGDVRLGKRELRMRVWNASEGNPFVIVETVRALREDPALSVPPASVRASIVARLERLGGIEERIVAAAAVIGRDCDFVLLQRVAGLESHDAAEAIEAVVRRRILTADGEGLDFVHDRIRDVAYDRLTETRRRVLHESVARTLAERRDDASVSALSTIAEHYSRARRWEDNVRWHRAAGDAAMVRGQLREAVSSFERALEGVARLPESSERAVIGVDIRLAARHARQRLGDMAGVLRDMDECEHAVSALNDRHRLGWIRVYQAAAHWVSGRSARAYALASEAGALAEALHDRPLQVAASMHLGGIETQLGRFRAAHDHLYGLLENLDERGGHPRFSLAALPGALTRSYVCLSQAELGAFPEAVRYGRRAVEIADEVNDGYSMIHARIGLVIGLLIRGTIGDARDALAPALELCRQRGLDFFPAPLTGMLGYIEAHDGHAEEGVRLLRNACEDGERGQTAYFLSFGYPWLAEALLRAGRVARACETASRAVALVRERQESTREAWALRIRAEATARVDARRAEARFHEARALAVELGMRPVVAHCHAGLGRVYRRLSKSDAALEHEHLAASMFAEMGMPGATATARREARVRSPRCDMHS